MDAVKRTGKPFIAAVSGVKNSGKTTFMEKLISELAGQGYRVAVIKHDGHEFQADREGTDTYRMRQAGAYGTCIFSSGQWQVVKQQQDVRAEELAEFFPEADIILLEQDKVLAEVRAYHEARHGSERWANRAAFSEATDLFRFRAIPGVEVSTKLFLLCEGCRYDITSVEDVKGRGMYVEILAKKVVAANG